MSSVIIKQKNISHGRGTKQKRETTIITENKSNDDKRRRRDILICFLFCFVYLPVFLYNMLHTPQFFCCVLLATERW